MKIVVAGGGSGGHVTPVLAVLNELKRHDPRLEVLFVTDSKFGDQAEAIMAQATAPVEVRRIHAGKFRRYHRVSVLRQLTDVPTLLRNARDFFVSLVGVCQSLSLLLRFRPDVVFIKGGFVCVPLGMAAKWLKIPIVIHDSDTYPGLANRIVSRWAVSIATGSPIEHYPYSPEKTHYTGIPIDAQFGPVSVKKQRALKDELGFHDLDKPLIVVTGGGLGAQVINQAVASIALQLTPRAAIYHITGTQAYDAVVAHAPEHIDYRIVPFISTGMAPVLGAADIVVSRVGATTMQELAALHKAVVMVPHPYLSGGHQLKNAQVYADAHAAVMVDQEELEQNPLVLLHTLGKLLDNPKQRQHLGEALSVFAREHAARDVAKLIIEAGHRP